MVRRSLVLLLVMLVSAVVPAATASNPPAASTINDVLPPRYRLGPASLKVADGTLAGGGTRLVYHDVLGQNVRSADLGTGARKQIGPNEGGRIILEVGPGGTPVVYARSNGFSKIRRVGPVGGTIEETSVTSQDFAVGHLGGVLFARGDMAWHWAADGTETQKTWGIIDGEGAPDRDRFVVVLPSGDVRVISRATDQLAVTMAAPLPGHTPVTYETTWLGADVVLSVKWTSGGSTAYDTWIIDTDTLTSRLMGAGKLVAVNADRALLKTDSGEGYLGYTTQNKAAKRLGTIADTTTAASWAASADFIVASNGTTKTRVFSWMGAGQATLDIVTGKRVDSLAIAGDGVVSEHFDQSRSELYVQPSKGGAVKKLPKSGQGTWDYAVGPDGWVY